MCQYTIRSINNKFIANAAPAVGVACEVGLPKVRLIVCREYGPPETLRLEERPSPVAREGEVVVEVRAAGVNFTDLLATQGRSQLKVKPPGVEVAGVITSTGPGVTRVVSGMRVLSTGFYGGYAEEIAFTETEVMLLPDDMDFETGATF